MGYDSLRSKKEAAKKTGPPQFAIIENGVRRRQSDCCQTKSGGRRRLRNIETRVSGIRSLPDIIFLNFFEPERGPSARRCSTKEN
jgi:hypothetical protein